jgi:hypothetical protein
MPINPFDQACRYLARLDPVALLSWLLNLPPSAFQGWLDTRTIPFPGEPDRTCDTVAFLLDLTRGGIPWAVVIEFQIDPDHLMFGRLLIYMGQVWIERKPYPGGSGPTMVARLSCSRRQQHVLPRGRRLWRDGT